MYIYTIVAKITTPIFEWVPDQMIIRWSGSGTLSVKQDYCETRYVKSVYIPVRMEYTSSGYFKVK